MPDLSPNLRKHKSCVSKTWLPWGQEKPDGAPQSSKTPSTSLESASLPLGTCSTVGMPAWGAHVAFRCDAFA